MMYRQRCQDAHCDELEKLANLAQFVLILHYDLRIHGSDCEASQNEWRRKLYGRQIATTIFESIEDLTSLCGRILKDSLKLVAPSETLESLRITLRDLKKFRTTYSTQLKEIRNNISAHRDHDALIQISTMNTMDISMILDLNENYILWLNELMSILDQTIVASFSCLSVGVKSSQPRQ